MNEGIRISEIQPARDPGMGGSLVLHPERTALLRHDLPAFHRNDNAPIRRYPKETILSAPGEQVPSWARRTSPGRRKTDIPLPERLQAGVEGIRDRVTISSRGEERSSTRHETYDRYGNLPSNAPFAVPMEPAVAANAIRREVTVVLVPYPVPVTRYVDPEPAGTLVWTPANVLPEPD